MSMTISGTHPTPFQRYLDRNSLFGELFLFQAKFEDTRCRLQVAQDANCLVSTRDTLCERASDR